MTQLKFGPPPARLFDVAPTEREVDFFKENGYLVA